MGSAVRAGFRRRIPTWPEFETDQGRVATTQCMAQELTRCSVQIGISGQEPLKTAHSSTPPCLKLNSHRLDGVLKFSSSFLEKYELLIQIAGIRCYHFSLRRSRRFLLLLGTLHLGRHCHRSCSPSSSPSPAGCCGPPQFLEGQFTRACSNRTSTCRANESF